jgi:hypothetical protein
MKIGFGGSIQPSADPSLTSKVLTVCALCDKETTQQNNLNRGIVNILAGFAPLRPAELVVITLQQMAGQIAV